MEYSVVIYNTSIMTNGKICVIVQKETKMGTEPGKEKNIMTNRIAYNLNGRYFGKAMLMNNKQCFDFVCSYKVRRKRGICIG